MSYIISNYPHITEWNMTCIQFSWAMSMGRGVPVFLKEWRSGFLSLKKWRIMKIRGVKTEKVKMDSEKMWRQQNVKFKCKEGLLKCEDCEVETPRHPQHDIYLLQKLSNLFIGKPFMYTHIIIYMYITKLSNLVTHVRKVYLCWFDDKLPQAICFCTPVISIAVYSALGEPDT